MVNNEEILDWLRTHNRNHNSDEFYQISEVYEISIDGNFDCSSFGLTYLPYKFKEVTGWFYAFDNKLTSLDNFPDKCEYVAVDLNPIEIPKHLWFFFEDIDTSKTPNKMHVSSYEIEIGENMNLEIDIEAIIRCQRQIKLSRLLE
jgi:hypothetical protein